MHSGYGVQNFIIKLKEKEKSLVSPDMKLSLGRLIKLGIQYSQFIKQFGFFLLLLLLSRFESEAKQTTTTEKGS